MKTSQSIKAIAPALLAAQRKIGAAKKGAENPFFHSKYADLGSVMEACKEALNEQGISILQPVITTDMGVAVETTLLHESGEFISAEILLAIKNENDPQAQGSAISYARRYSLQSMVFIPAEDDDAEKAIERPVAATAKTTTGKTCARHNKELKKFFNQHTNKWEYKHSSPLEKDANGNVTSWDSCYGDGFLSELEQNVPDPTDYM